ncbi:MAG: hypothetical protein AAGC97_05435 [Planctomycetota bacterium]
MNDCTTADRVGLQLSQLRQLSVAVLVLIPSWTGPVWSASPEPGSTTESRPMGDSTPLTVVRTIHDLNSPNEPVSVHWAVFDGNLAFDLPQTEARFWTILDFDRGEIVLLDGQRRVRTSVGIGYLQQAVARWHAEVTDPAKRRQLGMDVRVQEVDEHRCQIEFDAARYQMTTQVPARPDHAARFSRYVDWTLRLSMVRPSGLPPFARMTLNDHLSASGRVATQTRLTVHHSKSSDDVLVAQTRFVDGIDPSARDQVQQVRAMRITYRPVSLDDFNQSDP